MTLPRFLSRFDMIGNMWIFIGTPGKKLCIDDDKRGTGKSSWGENSIFNEIVKYGSNKVQIGTFWCKLRYPTSFFIFTYCKALKNQEPKKQETKKK